jgi:hypothetical protein
MRMTGIGVAQLAPGKVGHDVTCRSKKHGFAVPKGRKQRAIESNQKFTGPCP